MTSLPDESQLAAMYEEWVDSAAHLYEGDHYGHERAAFYAGAAAERERIAREIRPGQLEVLAGWLDRTSPIRGLRIPETPQTELRRWAGLLRGDQPEAPTT